MAKIILFDIDGTLIKSSNAHFVSFSKALKKVYGVKGDIYEVNPHGMTDKQIIIEILKKKSIRKEIIDLRIKECLEEMIKYFLIDIKKEDIFLLPGTESFLKYLRERNFLLGIATGNLEEIAQEKLKKKDIDHYFKFGAFGSDEIKRTNIIKRAIERAKEESEGKNKKDIFHIGDTPEDIFAGKENGISVIGMASGKYKEKDLKEAGADFVFKDFFEAREKFKMINNC